MISVLLVDDSETFLGSVRRLLEAAPDLRIVGTARTGREALERREWFRPDLVLMDIAMPDMTGIEVTRRIKQEPGAPRVIVLTLHDTAEHRRAATAACADAYIAKAQIATALMPMIRKMFPRESTGNGYKGFFTHLPVGLFRSTPAGDILDANAAMVELLGFPDHASLLATNARDLYVDPAERAALLARQEREGTIRGHEVRLRRRDGRVIWVRQSARVVRDDTGRVLYHEGCLEDVSDRQRAVEMLRESEAFLRTLVDTEPECVKVIGRDGTLLTINRSGVEMLEADAPEQFLGRPVTAIVVPEHRPVFEALTTRVLAGEPGRLEFDVVGLRGTRRPMETHAVPLRDREGRVFALLAITRDVTDRKRAEEALRQSEMRFRALIENALDIITVLDAGGRINYASPSVERVLGWSPAELIGRAAVDLTHPDDAARVAENLARGAIIPGYSASLEFRFRHKDGSWRVLEGIGKSLIDDLSIAGIVVNSRDVTERRQTEEAMQHTEKIAAMGQLLAGVAHELNNPLSVVLGRAALIGLASAGTPLAEHAARLTAAAERCVRIVGNFLALAAKRKTERRITALNEVVRQVLELLAYPLRVADVSVAQELDESIPLLWADPDQLHQVVVNLVSNAHQAMRESSASRILTVKTRLDAVTERVVLEVSDTGPGVPIGLRERIFEAFFTTKGPGTGTGLGLSLCRSLVEAHGGTIRVEDGDDGGARFVVELPAEDVPEGQLERPSVPPPATLTAQRVLVVDDEPEVAALVADFLESEGHQVETAGGGADALDKLGDCGWDVILCDLRMPGLDGPALRAEVERRCPGLERRFIFMSGDALGVDTEAPGVAGVPLVGKPFTLGELQRAIARVVQSG